MPLALYFGGSSASSSSSTTNNTDKRLIVSDSGTGVTADHSSVTFNSTDGGAIAGMFDYLKMASSAINTSYDKLLTTTADANKGFAGMVSTQQNKGTIDNRTITVLGGLALAVTGLFLWSRKK
ncbi:MAG TPA: hypothetical protein VIU93_02620 [Gallionellaceae bacterium]